MPVIAVGAKDEGKTLLIALTGEDMMKLAEGLPLTIKLDQVFGGKVECIVYMGDTEEDIKREIGKNSAVSSLKPTDTAEDLEKLLAEDRANSKH